VLHHEAALWSALRWGATPLGSEAIGRTRKTGQKAVARYYATRQAGFQCDRTGDLAG